MWTVYRTTNPTTSISDEGDQLPARFILHQNYPNPFNSNTLVHYQLPTAGHVLLEVYDILGHVVRTLVVERKPAGEYDIRFDGSGLPSGVYVYRLTAGPWVGSRKMILMK
jgi:hypothetical protein